MKYLSLLLMFLLVACPGSQEEKPADQKSAEEAATEEMEKEGMQMSIVTEELTYSANGVDLKGYIAYDKNIEGERPGILVVHEWWGHNDYSRKRAEMLAELGYTALAIDMYGEGKNTDHPDDANKFMMQVFENMDQGEARFNAALDLIKSHPTTNPEKTAAIGYCFGGAISLHMARIGTDLDGVVTFHGGLDSFHDPEPGSVKADILVFHGGDDKLVPQEKLDAFKEQMDAANADYNVVVFQGVPHSFTNPAADEYAEKYELPLGYDKEADEKSWNQMKAFLADIFRK